MLIGLTVDANNVVTAGLSGNSAFLAEETLTDQDIHSHALGGALSWRAAEYLQIEAQGRFNRSTFWREHPTFLFQPPMQSAPAGNHHQSRPGRSWARLAVVAAQHPEQRGPTARGSTRCWLNLKIGGACDLAQRMIYSFDYSPAWQLAVCGANCAGISGSVPTAALAAFLRRAPIGDIGEWVSFSPWASARSIASDDRLPDSLRSVLAMERKPWLVISSLL